MPAYDLAWYEAFTSAERNLPNYRGYTAEQRKAEATRLHQQHLQDVEAKALSGQATDLEDADLAAVLERSYRDSFAFESPADEAQLRSIVAVECELVKITRALGTKQTDRRRAQLRADLRQQTTVHRDLVVSAGLDRKARMEAKANKSPLEKWDQQMRRAEAWMAKLERELPEALAEVTDERDIREVIKSSLGYDFEIVDPIIATIKRVNGLDPQVQTH